MFRTINISKLLGQAMGEFADMLFENDNENEGDEEVQKAKRHMQDHIEISCPIFLRPLMRQILSVGKSIKIVRYLENNHILYSSRPQTSKRSMRDGNAPESKTLAKIQDTIDHQGIDYE